MILHDNASRVDNIAASQRFVETYYQALNSSKRDIAPFYMPVAAMPDGKPLPAILFNGNVIPDPAAMQKLFQEQMPKSEYVPGDYDCHVLNPNYVIESEQAASSASGRNMTILLTVSGFVKYGESRSVEPRGFSETFVLIPNPRAVGSGRSKHVKDWLIQSQNFRLVS